MRDISASGVISGTNKSKAISLENENILWESGILGKNDPKQLCQTVIYLIGIHFCLRGGNELRNMRYGPHAQIKRGIDSSNKDCLIFTEDVSKCRRGGIKSLSQPGKVVYAYHNEEDHDRCIVCLYDLFISKRPPGAREDSLFLAANTGKNTCKEKWYKNMALGHNSIANIVKTLTAGLPGRYTNQSLRRTGATRLFQAGFEEDLICRKTGHKSNAARAYKEVSSIQEQELSSALYGVKKGESSCFVSLKRKTDISTEAHQFSTKKRIDSLIEGNHFENCTVNINVKIGGTD